VAVEEHLNQCPECHEFLAALERQDRALTSALTHDPGDEHFEALAARIEARLGEAPAQEPASGPGPWRLRGAARMARGLLGRACAASARRSGPAPWRR
jgi:anti-sigma factor RsiW